MIKLASKNERSPSIIAETRNGTSIRQKLIPLLSMAMISLRDAILEVKKITAIKVSK